jgi:hypothetical protein
MSEETNLDPLQKLWKEQERQPMELTVDQISRKADSFQRTIRWRNIREYAASALVIAFFGWYAVVAHTALMRMACAAVIAAAIYVAYYLRKHGSATPELAASTVDHLASHRRQLERQRDLLRSIWRWYLGPLVPGLVLFAISIPIEQSRFGRGPWITAAIILVSGAVVFGGIAWLNRVGARQLQRQIDALVRSTPDQEQS